MFKRSLLPTYQEDANVLIFSLKLFSEVSYLIPIFVTDLTTKSVFLCESEENHL
jgi:hypothetical protein